MVAVGAVTEDSVRLWVRADSPGRQKVELTPARGGEAVEREFEVPAAIERDKTAVVVVRGLSPDTQYEYSVCRQGSGPWVAGSFRTTTAVGVWPEEPWSIAFMSCHQPFDDEGALRPDARRFLRAVLDELDRSGTRFVWMLGDQMYADAPEALSLFDPGYARSVLPRGVGDILECSADEVRRVYQERYRLFWAQPEWQELMARWPCYPMLDDHEVVDNFGSDPRHVGSSWVSLREGALGAYRDYQDARLRDPEAPGSGPLHYRLDYGAFAAFVTDMRSTRDITAGRLFGTEQIDELESFLAESATRPVVAIVTTLPLFHVSGAMADFGATLTGRGDDFSDRPMHAAYRDEFDRVCRIIAEHRQRRPQQLLLMLSGDIHVGALSAVRWKEEAPCYQFVASGVTHVPGPVTGVLSQLAMSMAHANPHFGDAAVSCRSPRVDAFGSGKNPLRALHVGLLEFGTPADEASGRPPVRLSLLAESAGGGVERVLCSERI